MSIASDSAIGQRLSLPLAGEGFGTAQGRSPGYFHEALSGIAAQRLKHPEAHVARIVGDDQGLGD
jgi:hypothetical protein